jgi:hypothetical protein
MRKQKCQKMIVQTKKEVKEMLRRRGQSTLEYAIIIAVVVGALLAMQHYVKRGVQGRYKSASDDMGEQFDPSAYTADFNATYKSDVQVKVEDKKSQTAFMDDAIANKTGSESLATWGEKDVFGK